MATLKKTLNRFDGIALLVGITIGSEFCHTSNHRKIFEFFFNSNFIVGSGFYFCLYGALIYAGRLGYRYGW